MAKGHPMVIVGALLQRHHQAVLQGFLGLFFVGRAL